MTFLTMPNRVTFNTYHGALRQVIKDRLKRAALDHKSASVMAGFHQDTLGHVLGARRLATVRIMNAIAPVLGTTAEQLHREAKALCDDE